MLFFIDTAELQEIEQAQMMGILDGVTTNPSLMAKIGVQGQSAITAHYQKICQLVKAPVSAEVLSTDYKKMIEEGEILAALDPNIVVKIPMTIDGVKALYHFKQKNIPTNCTLIFSAAQALLAAKAGATYVSPFVGRLDDIATDGLRLIEEIRLIFDNYNFDTQILAASIRHPMHILDCAKIGADVITAPLSALKGLFGHPLTDLGLAKFIEDAKKLQ